MREKHLALISDINDSIAFAVSVSRFDGVSQAFVHLWPEFSHYELCSANIGTLVSLMDEEMNE